MKVYLDNAATTRVRAEVLEEIMPFFSEKYGNASSLHSFGTEAREAIEKSRDKAAKILGVKPGELFFTSGATESDNLALKGAAFAGKRKGKNHIIVSAIEHDAVLHSAKWLKAQGFDITILPVDSEGFVDPENVRKAITDKTALVSVMYANNEIGTIEPIKEIGEVCAERGVLFHSDAVQAFGKVPLKLENVSMLSLSGHKIYGPKGIGVFVKKVDASIDPLIHGGGHEKGMRSGTENTPGIIGMAKAMELGIEEMGGEVPRQIKLRDKLIKGIQEISDTKINGPLEKRLANNVNASFKFIEGESLLLMLDEKGVAASTGSACSSPNLEPSHVLLAIGLDHGLAHGSLRLSLGRNNSMKEIDYTLDVLPDVVKRIRKISPFG